jgi:hemerythrin
MVTTKVANGIWWVEVPEADLRILCGCPADSVKHLARAGLITAVTKNGVTFESGPNAILLSDTPVQGGGFANLAEFPLLQMLYRQGMLIPKHPGNTGRKPLLIGLGDQVRSQAEYFFRGNYGLISVEEIESWGVPRETALEMFRVKSWFAFGAIRTTADLVDMRPLDADAVTLAPGVVVHRAGFNRYEFIAGGETATVDLTLAPGEEYEPSYQLPAASVTPARFSVIHVGEGDGWDHTRPCMGSIVCSDGLLYLVDAGPNITRSLAALGLGVGDIEGIFHTHAHDDHFAGMTSLVRSEKRLKYFAVPFVRGSVQKKLAALTRMENGGLDRFFEIHDLVLDEWNDVGGMQVRPVFSPHPVDTTVMYFRSGSGKARRTYLHLADIPSVDVLDKLGAPRDGVPSLSAPSRARFQECLLGPVDLKKVDAGGGIIHGNALDFKSDASSRLLLSHGAVTVPPGMPRAATVAAFGQEDLLRPGRVPDPQRARARAFLADLFPGVPQERFAALTARPPRLVPAGSVLAGPGAKDVLLVVSGVVEERVTGAGAARRRGPGALLGATEGADSATPAAEAVAVSAVTFLPIPAAAYRAFVRRDRTAEARRRAARMREVLAACPLFAGVFSDGVLNSVASAMHQRRAKSGEIIATGRRAEIAVLVEGEVDLTVGGRLVETLAPGSFWGEERIVRGTPALAEARAEGAVVFCTIPGSALRAIPIVQWGMKESFERRLHALREGFTFEWTESFSVGVAEIDEQHRQLFALTNSLARAMTVSPGLAGHETKLRKLLHDARAHFETEEALLRERGYREVEAQQQEHAALLAILERLVGAGEKRSRPRSATAADYLKDWLIRHILVEDTQYRALLESRPSSGRQRVAGASARTKRGATRRTPLSRRTS